MSYTERHVFQRRISLLEFLLQHGWKPTRDQGREEVAGLCPLHRESRPSFYVNRRKQVFYCHGCGRGGGLAQLVRLLDLCGELPAPAPTTHGLPEKLLEHTYRFYQWQLAHSPDAGAYLAGRGIHDPAVVRRMRIGYAPGASLRGYLARLGYPRPALGERGLIDPRGRDAFFRCLTFPLPAAGNLYGRSISDGLCRHRFLPGSKGGLYGWEQPLPFPRVILVEGLFDLAALWQAGFDDAVAGLGTHLNPLQLTQLGRLDAGVVYICFDADANGSGARAAYRLSGQLRQAGVEALRVALPPGHDPNSFFVAGATAVDFQRCLEGARP